MLSLGANLPPAALLLVPPVLVVQVAIGPAPKDDVAAAPIYKKLLELNASALLHAAYGLENEQIVLAAALELENLDLNELEAVLADIDVALSEHVPALRGMVQPLPEVEKQSWDFSNASPRSSNRTSTT